MNGRSASRLDLTGPQLRADQAGYVLDGVVIDGFADRPELTPASRWQIAAWAAAFDHPLSSAQETLLGTSSPTDETGLAILAAATRNREIDMPLAHRLGLDARLDEHELLLLREPWRGIESREPREYPLAVSELAELTAISVKQVRSWEQAGLLPGYRIEGQRQFFSAAVIHAFALRQLDRYQVASLASLHSAAPADPFVDLVEYTLELRRQRQAEETGMGADLFNSVRRLLRRLTETRSEPGVGTDLASVEHVPQCDVPQMRWFAWTTLDRTVKLHDALEDTLTYTEHIGDDEAAAWSVPLSLTYREQQTSYDVVVHPAHRRGWALSVDLGLVAQRKVEAIRFGKELSGHLGTGSVRVYSKTDGQVVAPRRPRGDVLPADSID